MRETAYNGAEDKKYTTIFYIYKFYIFMFNNLIWSLTIHLHSSENPKVDSATHRKPDNKTTNRNVEEDITHEQQEMDWLSRIIHYLHELSRNLEYKTGT